MFNNTILAKFIVAKNFILLMGIFIIMEDINNNKIKEFGYILIFSLCIICLEIIMMFLNRFGISKTKYNLTLFSLISFVLSVIISHIIVLVVIFYTVFTEIYLYMICALLLINMLVILKALFIKKQLFFKENNDTEKKEINSKMLLPFTVTGIWLSKYIIDNYSYNKGLKMVSIVMASVYLLLEMIFMYSMVILLKKVIKGDKSWYNNLISEDKKRKKV
ncbi:MAG: hypothetical protein ABF289_13580 [Clostridiales bacterium]